MDGEISRRRILASVGVSGLVGLSGCGWLSGTRTSLAGVRVLNPYYGTEHVDIRIEQAGEMVVEESLSVTTEDGAKTVACSWDRDGEEPIIGARIADDDADWEQLDLIERDEETTLVEVIVRPELGASFIVKGADDDYFVDVCAQEQ